jgi:hypothetical protein
MTEQVRLQMINQLEKAESAVFRCTYAAMPDRFINRAETIVRKIVDLREDIEAEALVRGQENGR